MSIHEDDEHEDEWTEPEEEDLVTDDYIKFWSHGMSNRRPAVVVAEDEDWREEVRLWMYSQKFWPNVWHISDHGNWLLLSLYPED